MHSFRIRLAIGALVASCTVFGQAAVHDVVHAGGNTIDIVGPAGSGSFGAAVLGLPNGNYVIADPDFDDVDGVDVGAVSLYNGATNQVISTLTGGTAGDHVGGGGLFAVGAGNFVVVSPLYDKPGPANTTLVDTGAATWISGATGLDAKVSAANSLIGSTSGDKVGDGGVLTLTNGNYVVLSDLWTISGLTAAGAATWASGNAGITGPITGSNSSVGTNAGDKVGTGFGSFALPNGNYVLVASGWTNGSKAKAGAVALVDGTSGRFVATNVHGGFNSSNALVGGTAQDKIGDYGITILRNGNYIVQSPDWIDAASHVVGAATFELANGGATGAVSTSNSLYGSTASDMVGQFVTALTDDNYVVVSPNWAFGGAEFQSGAVTWGNGSTGIIGAVTTVNSVYGAKSGSRVGGNGASAVHGGAYVIDSPSWQTQSFTPIGAVTFAAAGGVTVGAVSGGNSLIGAASGEGVGDSVIVLTNGNYVVVSPHWRNGGTAGVGAATWGSGTTGVHGLVTAANSLIGTSTLDAVGNLGVIALTNGNYVVSSSVWDNGSIANVGAVTWGNGTTGVHGTISVTNSLIGASKDDGVGSFGLTALTNGNYVVKSFGFDLGAAADAGATTWGNGATGTTGVVGTANSVVGVAAGDLVGAKVAALADGNYVIKSPKFNAGGSLLGASTWASGSGPTSEVVGSTNSLLGATGNQDFDEDTQTLPDGGYIVQSKHWQNGSLADAGAVTYSAPGGIDGFVSADNSAVGAAAGSGPTTQVFPIVRNVAGAVLVRRVAENIVTLLYPPVASAHDAISLAPARLVDSRTGESTVDGTLAGSGRILAGTTLTVPVGGRGGVADDATAVSLNVTITDPSVAGFVTVYPCGADRPAASNINYSPGQTIANAVLAKVGDDRSVCVYSSQATDLIVDVNEFFPATSSYAPVNPGRLLETRSGLTTIDGLGNGDGLRAGGSVTEVQVTGRAAVPADATAAALNVTATEPAADGFVTVYPCGADRPTASNLNFTANETIANLAISQLGASGKVCIFTSQPTHLVVDLNGYMPAITAYRSLDPARLLETRAGLTTIDGEFNGAGAPPAGTVTTLTVGGRGGVPGNATSVVLDVTVTNPQVAGFVTVYPCGITPPLASNVNFAVGDTVANAVLVKVGTGGSVCIRNSQTTDLIADVVGYLGS